jgi:hypothetical protein
VKIERYTIRQLNEMLAQGVDFEESLSLPQARVLAQVNNPRAASDDVVLLLGYEGKKVVGSLGIIPDAIFPNGERKQIGWLNNWNGASDKSHSGIGALLFLTAMSIYGNSIAVSGFTDEARKVYEGSRKFVTLKEKKGATVYIRMNSAGIVSRRLPSKRLFGSLLKGVDTSLNFVIDLRLKRWQARQARQQDYSASQVPRIDGELAAFIEEVRGNELFRRGATEFNWMKEFPWEHGSERESVFIKIRDLGRNLVGFAFLKFAGGSVTVPYYFCNPKHFRLLLKAIAQYLTQSGASELLVYNAKIVAGLLEINFPVLHQRPRRKSFLISKAFKDLNLAGYQLHDGDGDAFI